MTYQTWAIHNVHFSLLLACCCVQSALAQPEFFVVPGNVVGGDQPFLNSAPVPQTRFDFQSFSNGRRIATLGSMADCTIRDLADGTERGAPRIFADEDFNASGRVYDRALLGQVFGTGVGGWIRLDFRRPVYGIGAWYFDDYLGAPNYARLRIINVHGAQFLSPALDAGNGNAHAVEGFLGATSSVGISAVVFENYNSTTNAPHPMGELDHIVLCGQSPIVELEPLMATFAENSEDWEVASVDPAALEDQLQFVVPMGFQSNAGNPPGSLRFTEQSSWNWHECFGASSGWIGDRSAYYGGVLSFDARYDGTQSLVEVYLRGNGQIIRSSVPTSTPTQWSTYSVDLTESLWFHPQTELPVSPALFLTVLHDLQGIYFEADWGTSISNSSADNVRLECGALTASAVSDRASACVGTSISMSLLPSPGEAACQWRRNSLPLSDDANVIGSATAQLSVLNSRAMDAGVYDCVVATACGIVISDPVTLDVYCSCGPFTSIAGRIDSFQLPRDGLEIPPHPATPSSALQSALTRPTIDFDEIPGENSVTAERNVAHTFSAISNNLTESTLTFVSRAGTVSITQTDQLRLGFTTNPGTLHVEYARELGDLAGTPWTYGTEETFSLDLATLPAAIGGTILDQINAHGFLDFIVSDDSGVDYVQLTGVTTDGSTVAYVASGPSDTAICAGAPATLSVTVGGSPPHIYQWRKDSIEIAGATSNTLVIVDVTSADAGSYDCVVSNVCHTVTSASATLTVDVLPGDFNEDGVVDSDDFTLELPCFAGPGVPNTGCTAALFGLADFDDEDDIDMHDFAEFQRLVGSVCP